MGKEIVLKKETIFGNLEGEIIKEDGGLTLRLVDNKNSKQPFLKMNTLEAIEKLSDYLTYSIELINKYLEK